MVQRSRSFEQDSPKIIPHPWGLHCPLRVNKFEHVHETGSCCNPFCCMDCLENLMKSKSLSNPTHINLPCTKRFEISVSRSRICVIKLLGIWDEFWHKLRGLQRLGLLINSIVGMPELAAVQSPPLTWNKEEMLMSSNLQGTYEIYGGVPWYFIAWHWCVIWCNALALVDVTCSNPSR